MSAMNRLNQSQVNNIEWSTTRFTLEAIAKNNSFFNKVRNSTPKQIANFLCAFGGTQCLDVLGVVRFSELLNIAKKSPKFKEFDFVAVLSTELHMPESFVFEYENCVDISSMYTQEWCNAEKIAKYAESIDIVGAIIYNCSMNPERNRFIEMVKSEVELAIHHSYYGFCVSSLFLDKYGISMKFSSSDEKIRNTVINKKTIHKAGVSELMQYEGLTIDECSYKMNTSKGNYGSLIRLVLYIRSVYDEV